MIPLKDSYLFQRLNRDPQPPVEQPKPQLTGESFVRDSREQAERRRGKRKERKA